MRGTVSEVVVAHRDRLARIGSGLIEHIISRCGAVLTVIEDRACDGCPEELANDVLEVLTHFTAKHNGRRSYNNREDTSPP
jgi:predicted site-specific integrase-resolvase